MEIEKAIQHAIDGNAVLFLGSGFAADATSISNKAFPIAKEFAKSLSRAIPTSDEIDDLMISSNAYIKKFGEEKLVKLLEETFTTKQLEEKHRHIAHVPWKSIFTTNYDDAIETSYKEAGIPIKPVTIDLDTHEYTSRKATCVHINGYIGSLSPQTLNKSFKLTNYSYLTEEFSKSKWSFIFRREIEAAKAVIFIGYSMYDIDIARILYGNNETKDKTIFIERKGLSEEWISFSTQSEFGRVFPMGAEDFWEKFKEVEKTYTKQETFDELISLSRFNPELLANEPTDNDYWALLLKGDYTEDSLYTSLVKNQPLLINRRENQKVAQLISEDYRAVFVLGDLGNGKTMVMIGAASQLFRQGYDVYFLDDDADFHPDDINTISNKNNKTVIFIENYIRHLDAIKNLLLRSNNQTKIVCSARSVLHEVNIHKVEELFQNQSYYEVYIDKLDNADITKISNSLTSYKVWGRFLVVSCGT